MTFAGLVRDPIRKRKRALPFILIAAVVLAAAAICDWRRPPRQQVSVAFYERIVLGGYRTFLKPLSDRFVICRFRPTCSVYSEEAMHVHGFPKGLWLTTRRLFRCMPWVAAGTRDPVPPREQGARTKITTDTKDKNPL